MTYRVSLLKISLYLDVKRMFLRYEFSGAPFIPQPKDQLLYPEVLKIETKCRYFFISGYDE